MAVILDDLVKNWRKKLPGHIHVLVLLFGDDPANTFFSKVWTDRLKMKTLKRIRVARTHGLRVIKLRYQVIVS